MLNGLRYRDVSSTALLVFLVASTGCFCPKTRPVPPPPAPYAVSIGAEPGSASIFLGEKPLGTTPLSTRISSVDDLARLSARQGTDTALEQRIQVISETDFNVLFRFSKEPSAVAKRLGLTRVLVFDFSDKIMFDSGKSDLKVESESILARQAAVLRDSFPGVDVHVCGHTDSVGSPESNLGLSLRRAQAVASQLERHGLPASRMKVNGLGEEFPLEGNDTDDGRARNRRTELILPR